MARPYSSMQKHNTKKCKTCIYRASKYAPNLCDYILIEGHSRGCPTEDCTRYVKGKRIVKEFKL